jgi:cyclopropane fatty-acyl-phospholipid synthase-like methyltransferase
MTIDKASDHTERVTRYYEQNTSTFLRLGNDGGSAAIHIALWPEGVDTVEAAMNVAHDLIYEAIQENSTPVTRVADLGCGVGSALLYLHDRLPMNVQLEGLTIGTLSDAQIQAMNRSRVHIQHGDFHKAASLLPQCEFAFAIEAFAHAADPARFFQEVGKLLVPGGRLVIIDDTCTSDKTPSATLNCYRTNWLTPSVLPLSTLDKYASQAGLMRTETKNLTSWIQLGRPRDKLLRWSLPLWAWTSPWWNYAKSMRGGDARQRCLETNETEFSILTYEKQKG